MWKILKASKGNNSGCFVEGHGCSLIWYYSPKQFRYHLVQMHLLICGLSLLVHLKQVRRASQTKFHNLKILHEVIFITGSLNVIIHGVLLEVYWLEVLSLYLTVNNSEYGVEWLKNILILERLIKLNGLVQGQKHLFILEIVFLDGLVWRE